MSQTRRKTYLAIVGVAAWAALVCVAAVAEPGTTPPVARNAYQTQMTFDPALAAAAQRASVLKAVTFDGGDRIILSTTGKPLCDLFNLDKGRHVVVDLYGTINKCSAQTVTAPSGSCVAQVRSSLFAVQPQFVSRVVLDLDKPGTVTMREEPGQVVLTLSPLTRSFDEAPTVGESVAAFRALVAEEQGRLAIARAGFEETELRATAAHTERGAAGMTSSAKSLLAKHDETAGALRTELAGVISKASQTYRAYQRQAAQLSDRLKGGDTTKVSAQRDLARLRSDFDVSRSRTLTALARVRKQQDAAWQDVNVGLLALAIAPSDKKPEPALSATTDVSSPDATITQLTSQLASLSSETDSESTSVSDDSLSRLSRELARVGADQAGPSPLMRLAQAGAPEESPERSLTALAAAEDATPPTPSVTTASAPPTSSKASQPGPASTASSASAGASTTSSPAAATAAKPPKAFQLLGTASATRKTAAPSVKTSAPAVVSTPAKTLAKERSQTKGNATTTVASKLAKEGTATKSGEAPAPEVQTIGKAKKVSGGIDPLDQPVTINFYQMDLANAVSLLAQKAQINVIAGTDIKGTVTADIQNVPLKKAMETVLRMNNLGMVEEDGIYRIVPYEQAMAANLVTKMIYLVNAQADNVKQTLDPIIMAMPEGKEISLSANAATNVVILSGPPAQVKQLQEMITSLDVAKPTLPTVTEALKLNYLEPQDVKPIVQSMLTKGGKNAPGGQVEVDEKGRNLVVTDLPVVVEQVRDLLKKLDVPVKQVGIHGMIVDAVLTDNAETGVDWLMNAVKTTNRRGIIPGSLQNASFGTNLGLPSTASAGALTLGLLTRNINLTSTIQAQVESSNAKILASPVVVTVENKPAEIKIVQKYPYQKQTQTTQGPPMVSTAFMDIGVDMTVTPRITHDNDVIVDLSTKESSISGFAADGTPIENDREAMSTIRMQDGQTAFIAGLRNHANTLDVKKVPVLGDIPVLNFMFRNTSSNKSNTELLVFLTCQVAAENLPELTPKEQNSYDELGATPAVPDGQRQLFHSMVKPGDQRDPMWKWRRTK